jgi:hypothetical protein
MSRVADALQKASDPTRRSEPSERPNHPWHDGLDEAAAARVAITPLLRSTLAGFSPTMRQQVAGLVERVFLSASTAPARQVGFVAMDHATRSSAVTAAAAETLAGLTSGAICVVDANAARPSLHERFGVANDFGLVDALAAGHPLIDAAYRCGANLWLIPAGAAATRVAASEHTRAQVAHLGRSFDFVILDLEPMGEPGEPGGLAAQVEGVVLVMASDATRRARGRAVVEGLRASGAAILGAVLTDRRSPVPGFVDRWL